MRTLRILIPKPDTIPGLVIDRGSGVVASDESHPDPRMVEVYYEGNRFNAENMRTFEAKVQQAAGRLAQHYPTVARGYFQLADFDVVGTYHFSDDWQDKQMLITDPERVRAWEGNHGA